jgi:hypothetical protein
MTKKSPAEEEKLIDINGERLTRTFSFLRGQSAETKNDSSLVFSHDLDSEEKR